MKEFLMSFDRREKINNLVAILVSDTPNRKFKIDNFLLTGDFHLKNSNRRSITLPEDDEVDGIYIGSKDMYLDFKTLISDEADCENIDDIYLKFRGCRFIFQHELDRIIQLKDVINHSLQILGKDSYLLREDEKYWVYPFIEDNVKKRVLSLRTGSTQKEELSDEFLVPFSEYKPKKPIEDESLTMAYGFKFNPYYILQDLGGDKFYVLPVKISVDEKDLNNPNKNSQIYFEQDKLIVSNPIYVEKDFIPKLVYEKYTFEKKENIYILVDKTI